MNVYLVKFSIHDNIENNIPIKKVVVTKITNQIVFGGAWFNKFIDEIIDIE